MVWEKFKQFVGIGKHGRETAPDGASLPAAASGTDDDSFPDIKWLGAEENPWGIPVLDVRPFTFTMTSTSADPLCATNAISFGQDDGAGFIGQMPQAARSIPSTLTFPVDRMLADGVLFIPRQMEHKWAIFCHQKKIICVRSWRRQVAVVADVEDEADQIRITKIVGVFSADDEDPAFTERSLDFLLRTHVLGLPYPAPLPADMETSHQAIAAWCFSLYGNMVASATSQPFERAQPDKPMRSHSRLHIAVARKDMAAIKACIEAGVPADLLAGDGLAPLHWALANADIAVMALLLLHKSPVDVRSVQGATPLMNAVQAANLAAVSFMLDRGANVNAQDYRGFTPLHRAAEMGLLDIAKMLIGAGASPLVDAEGHSPRSFANDRGDPDMIKLLSAAA